MMKVIKTNTVDSSYILEELKKNFSQNHGKKHLLIVPDRVVLSYEIMVLDYLDIQGSMDIRVVSFSTLADYVLGKKSQLMLNNQTEIMLIRKIIEDNKKDLLFYRQVSNYVGFAGEVLNLLTLIRSNGITLEALRELSNVVPLKFQNKIKDILLIYDKYIDQLHRGYYDGISKLEALIEEAEEKDILAYDKTPFDFIYLSEFIGFSKVELNIIKALLKRNSNITITVPYSNGENESIFPKSLCSTFQDMAKSEGVPFKIEEQNEELHGDLKNIYDNLFTYKTPILKEKQDNKVNVFVSLNPNQEVKELAIKIKRKVKEGLRYKDIAVVCCDLNNYLSSIQSIFERFDIPFYADAKSQLINQNLTKLILGALKVYINNYSLSDVINFAKELGGIFKDTDIDTFENYCLKFGIEYESGYINPFTMGEDYEKDISNKIRAKIVEYIDAFKDKKTNDILSYTNCIREFLRRIDVEKVVSNFANKQIEKGYIVEASITEQTYEKIDVVIAQMENLLGDCKISFEQFIKIFETTITSVTISTIPMGLDCVYIGDCQNTTYEKKKAMYIIAANESLFPVEKVHSGMLTMQDIEVWNKCSVAIYPTVYDENRESKLFALMTMLKPTESLDISYPKYNNVGEKLNPSSILEFIKQVTVYSEDIVDPIKNYLDIDELKNHFLSRKNVLEDLISLKKQVEMGEVEYTEEVKKCMNILYTIACEDKNQKEIDRLLNKDYHVKDAIKNKENYTLVGNGSVSKFEKYLECPFRYFMDYILKVKEREEAGLKVKDTGIILHKIMEEYFSQSDYDSKTDDEIEVFVKNILEKAIKGNFDFEYLGTQKFELEKKDLKESAIAYIKILVEKMKATSFKPYRMEMRFNDESQDGDQAKYKAMILNTKHGQIKINGVIDRIDKVGDMVYIVDYKTKSSIKLTPNEAIFGKKIQLLTYMKKVMEEEKAIPAGVFYLLLNSKYKSDFTMSDRLKYIGIVNNDEGVLQNLDSNFLKNENIKSKLFPVKKAVTKNGTSYSVNHTIRKGTDSAILGEDQLKNLCEYVMRLLSKAADEMQEGFIKPSPLRAESNDTEDFCHACKYCKYKGVCRISEKPENIRNEVKLKSEEIAEILSYMN